MERILNLQKLTESAYGEHGVLDSNESRYCSDQTNGCSTTTSACTGATVDTLGGW